MGICILTETPSVAMIDWHMRTNRIHGLPGDASGRPFWFVYFGA